MLSVQVTSEIFGSEPSLEGIPDIQLNLISERVTLENVIKKAVHEQIEIMADESVANVKVRDRLRNQYLDNKCLNNEDISDLAAKGKVAYTDLAKEVESLVVDVEIELQRAVAAFKNKNFKVFIDGEEVNGLEENVTLYDGCVIHFIRLIPLVGG